MRRRVIEWSNSAPTTTAPSTQLAPADIFSSILHIDLVLLYYPCTSFPDPSQNDILIIAQSASECISNYRRAFRDGQLRFFWRTTHNLFRSGVAMAYCVRLDSIHHYPDLDSADMIASINTCMSVLWAMVERYRLARYIEMRMRFCRILCLDLFVTLAAWAMCSVREHLSSRLSLHFGQIWHCLKHHKVLCIGGLEKYHGAEAIFACASESPLDFLGPLPS